MPSLTPAKIYAVAMVVTAGSWPLPLAKAAYSYSYDGYYTYSYAAIDCRDCDGYACNGREDWVGDGLCDDGQFGVNFWCDEFDMDGGDCVGTEGHYFDYA